MFYNYYGTVLPTNRKLMSLWETGYHERQHYVVKQSRAHMQSLVFSSMYTSLELKTLLNIM